MISFSALNDWLWPAVVEAAAAWRYFANSNKRHQEQLLNLARFAFIGAATDGRLDELVEDLKRWAALSPFHPGEDKE